MADITVKTRTTTTRRFTMEVGRDALILALNQELKASGDTKRIPPDATVYFMVPGGADWSNTAIDIDAEYPIHIEWEEQEVDA